MSTRSYYRSLKKPAWAPKPPVFRWLWTFLYPLILAVDVWAVWRWQAGELPVQVMVVLAVNLAANLLFTPIQFGLKNNKLAVADICIVLITAVAAIFLLWPYAIWASLFFVPYAAWVCVATVLQVQIAALNE